jgi:hypothetical protein
MSAQPTENYYVAQKSKLLKNFKKDAGPLLKASEPTYGKDFIDRVADEALQEYENLIPQIPYIGGKKNGLMGNLMGTVEVLALYKVLKRHGKSDEEIGELVWKGWEAMSKGYPRFLLRLAGWFQFTRFSQRMTKKMLAETQRREYPENWMAVYVEGDGVDFDYGIDFLECAIVKFFEAQGAAEFAPYVCLFDFAMSKACDLGLRRTMTIAEGHEKCDFRYKRGRETVGGWPPRFLERDEKPQE